MKAFIQFFLRSVVATLGGTITWLLIFLVYDQGIWESFGYGFIAAILIYFLLKAYMKYQVRKKGNLTRGEYKLVKENLRQAEEKVRRLQKSFFKLSNLLNLRQNIEILRVVRRIITITKQEPKRFFLAEEFYYSRLDSLVELAEKYAFLSAQPVKTRELNQSLRDTRITLNELSEQIKLDLYHMLEDDIDDLRFELDVAKHTMNKRLPLDRGHKHEK